jgi:MYXO-CTERM domain-containing protein
MRVLCVMAVWLGLTSAAHAQVELKNDGFASGGQAAFQGGFVTGEAAASRFVAPQAGLKLDKVVYLFGGSTATQTLTIRVYDDTAGTDVPGNELFTGGFQCTGSDTGFQVADVTSVDITLPAQFRVAIEFSHDGAPSVARDNDGTIAPDRNYIHAQISASSYQWVRSSSLGLTGDWIIRAQVSGGSTSMTDAGVMLDAATTGGACAGNAQCPAGQYCDLAAMTCTFDCRADPDCGGGTCNSLGQCVGLNSDDGGCVCHSDGHDPPLVLGLFVLLLLVRRR